MASQRTLPRTSVRTVGLAGRPADASALWLDQLCVSFSPAVLARASALLPNVLDIERFPHGTRFGAVHTGHVWTHEVWSHGTETPDGACAGSAIAPAAAASSASMPQPRC
jgi:hypothetical protein